MYKLSEQEFAECLFSFQVVTSAHFLMQFKEISTTESIAEVLKFAEKYVVNDLVNVQKDEILSKDEHGFKSRLLGGKLPTQNAT